MDGTAVARGRGRALGLLSVALVLGMSTWFSASAVVPQLREEWDLSDTAAAWLTIAVQLGFVTGAILSAVLNLADVLPARKVLLAGAAGAAAVNALLAAVSGAAAAIPLRFLTGFFLAGVYPPAFKLLATWFRKGRGRALGIAAGAIAVGSAAPHLVNGVGGLDWHIVVFATSVLTLAGGILASAGVREGPISFPPAVFNPHEARRVFANRGVRLASLGYFGHMWELYAMWTWFVVFFSATVEGGSEAAYATFAVIGIGGLSCWAGGVLADRYGRAETTAALLAASGTCAILIGLLADGPGWLVFGVGLVWGFSVIADSAQFSTLVTEHADQAYVGTALSMQLAVGFTLTVATIWLVPVLEDAVGWRWTFAFLAPGPALGVLAMLRLRRVPA